MAPVDAGRLIITLTDGRELLYRRTDLRSHKGCRVFQYAGTRTSP